MDEAGNLVEHPFFIRNTNDYEGLNEIIKTGFNYEYYYELDFIKVKNDTGSFIRNKYETNYYLSVNDKMIYESKIEAVEEEYEEEE